MTGPTRTPRPSLGDFWLDLPREGRLLLSVVAFQFVGTGLVLPFWVVYLHEIRGIGLGTVGLLLGWLSFVGFAMTAPGGAAIDRFGARRVMICATVSTMTGQLTMAFADRVWLAALGLSLVGAGFGVTWPAAQSLIATVIPTRIRQRYFGINFALLNLGIGIGGIIGGFVADVREPSTFQAMYLWESASYLPVLYLLLVPLRHVGAPTAAELDDDGARVRTSYLQVLRRPAVKSLVLLSFAGSFVGYAQFMTGFPACAREVGEVSTRALGWGFAANTAVIVMLQLVVLQRIEGRRRTRVIVVMSVLWALTWLMLAGSGLVAGSVAAGLVVGASASVFALGETLLQPTIPAMINDMAPDHLRGRYNGITSSAFQLASVSGPVTAGFLIDHGWQAGYIGLLVLGCVGLAAFTVLHVEPRLTPEANGLRTLDPVGNSG